MTQSLTPPFPILYEDNHLLAIEKPAGMLSQADDSGAPDVLTQAKLYIKQKYEKPGQVYLGLVQRLDRNVSGVMLLARTSKAASRLSQQIRNQIMQKTYHALIASSKKLYIPVQGRLEDLLVKDKRMRKARIVSEALASKAQNSGKAKEKAKPAVLSYELEMEPGSPSAKDLAERLVFVSSNQTALGRPSTALLKIHLETGRFHQIRAQLAHHLAPIVGDQKYGSEFTLAPNKLCLHCSSLTLEHPTQKTQLVIESPASFKNFLNDLCFFPEKL